MSGLKTLDAFNASGEVDDIAANSVALGTDTTGNYVATVAGGGGITVTGSGSETAAVTVAHTDTSSQGSVNNSGNTVIQDITLDTYGHVTGIGTTTISVGSSIPVNDGSSVGSIIFGEYQPVTNMFTSGSITFSPGSTANTQQLWWWWNQGQSFGTVARGTRLVGGTWRRMTYGKGNNVNYGRDWCMAIRTG